MFRHPVRPGFLHRHHAHAGALGLHIRRKILGCAAAGGQDDAVTRVADNGIELIDNRLAVPVIFLTGTADQHEGLALRYLRAGAYAVDGPDRGEDARIALPPGAQIVPRHDAEIEEAERQAGFHAHHAKATQVACQTQGCQMGAVPGAENQVRAGQIQIHPLVEELVEKGLAGDIDLVAGVLQVRLELPSAADQGIGQSFRLRKVPPLSVTDDIDNHVSAVYVSNRQGNGAAEFLPQEGRIERAAGERIGCYAAAHRRVE